MATKVFCDKCGKYITEGNRVGVIRVEVRQKYYEVCGDCADLIASFIGNEREGRTRRPEEDYTTEDKPRGVE